MPTPQQLANITASEGDDSTTQDDDDGTTTTSWPDGSSRVDYPDGSATVMFPDNAVLNLNTDGTRTLNDENGTPLDPSTGWPTAGGGPLPTPPDQGPDRALHLLEGDEAIADVKEAVDLLNTFKDALEGELDPVEWFTTWLKMVIQVIKAVETEERGAYMRGWCYAVLYSALDMGSPPTPTFFGSDRGADQDTLDATSWDTGVSKGEADMDARPDGIKMRNRILLRVAQDGSQPNVTLDALWQAACTRTDDTKLAEAYEHLGWPDPTGA